MKSWPMSEVLSRTFVLPTVACRRGNWIWAMYVPSSSNTPMTINIRT